MPFSIVSPSYGMKSYTGCTSMSYLWTSPTWVISVGCGPSGTGSSTVCHLPSAVPTSPPPPHMLLPPGCSSSPKLLLWGCPWAPPLDVIHCCTVDAFVAAWEDLLHTVPTGCRGTACSPVGLLEFLLPSFCTNLVASFPFLTPRCCCAAVFPLLNWVSQSTVSITYGSALAVTDLARGTAELWSQSPHLQPPTTKTLSC